MKREVVPDVEPERESERHAARQEDVSAFTIEMPSAEELVDEEVVLLHYRRIHDVVEVERGAATARDIAAQTEVVSQHEVVPRIEAPGATLPPRARFEDEDVAV